MQGVTGLWTEGNLCDITLVADGKSIAAHRIILAAVSPFFRRMFIGYFKESKQSEVHLEGIGYEALEVIVKCIYTDVLDMNGSEVLAAAHFLQINSIVYACEQGMICELSDDYENCFLYLEDFEKFDLDEGRLAAISHILKNFVPLSKTPDFLKIRKDALCSFLDHPDLIISEEIEAFRAVKAWIEHDASRSKHGEEIMQYIRLAFIPVETLKQEVRKAEFMQSNETCARLLSEALKYHDNIYAQPSIQATITKPRGSASLFILEEENANQVEDLNLDFNDDDDNDDDDDEDFKENYAKILKLGKNYLTCGEKYSLCKKVNVGVPLGWMSFNLVDFGSFVYVLGLDSRYFSMVNKRYDPNMNKWLDLEPMPSGPARGCAAARVGTTIVVAGGYMCDSSDDHDESLQSSGSGFLTETFLYDILTNSWKLGPGLPGPLQSPGIACLNNIVYAAGGLTSEDNDCTKMWAYDLDQDVWVEKPDFSEIGSGFGCLLNAVDDKLILCYDYTSEHKAAIFDVVQNQWSYVPLPQFGDCMGNKSAFVHESELYIFYTERSEEVGKAIKVNSRGQAVVLHDFLPKFHIRLRCKTIFADYLSPESDMLGGTP